MELYNLSGNVGAVPHNQVYCRAQHTTCNEIRMRAVALHVTSTL